VARPHQLMSTNTHATRRRKALLLGWGILLVLLTAGGYLAFQGTSADALNQPPTSNQIAQGRQIYQQNCAACHGVQAGGQDHKQPKGGIQADGTQLAPALNGAGHAWHHDNTLLFNTVKNGSVASDSPMQGFAGRLSDDAIVSVLQYIKSLWPAVIRTRHAMNR